MPDPSHHHLLVRSLFAAIARRYDLANHLLSGGLDHYWRWRAGRVVKSWQPERILDLATGSGDLAITLRQVRPGSLIVAADFCQPMLEEAARKGVPNLVLADGLALPFADQSFDAVTIAFGLRNMESWDGALREMARVLRPGGRLLVLDFSVPPPPLRWLYRPYLHYVLPIFASLVTGQRAAYEYLGASIESFPHGAAMGALMSSAGFAEPRSTHLSGGIAALYTALRPGGSAGPRVSPAP